jgi:limonene-1,2-epoxide hydrolase
MTARIDLLRQVMDAASRRDKAAFLAAFDPAIEYHYHVGTRPLVGVEWVDRFISKYWASHSETEWVLTHWAENGDVLFTEGREDYINAAGVKVSHPYAGVITFTDDRITGWRDYFQMKDPAAAG